MAQGILYVETRPSSPDREAEYNEWYDQVHLRQVIGLDGFVSARRLAAVNDDGPYVALYEIEAEDLQAVADELMAFAQAGGFDMSESMQSDPMPLVRLLRVITSV